MTMPTIDGLLAVMKTFDAGSPCMGHAVALRDCILAASATGLPPAMPTGDPAPDGILRNGAGPGGPGGPGDQPPGHTLGAQQGGVRFAPSDAGGRPDGDVAVATATETLLDSGQGSVEKDDDDEIEKELKSDAFGQAIMRDHSLTQDEVDMFQVDV